MLIARGVLVKVNSVMIPGINDRHLEAVSQHIKAKGAFLHNVMPLIAEPEHGTFYGMTGQRGPTLEELQALQDKCAGDMKMMRHCRQCRADAVGMLGEDRNAEFTLDKVTDREIDYAAAMHRRAAYRTAIEAGRRSHQTHSSRETVVALSSLRRRKKATRPVLIAVASGGGGIINQHFGGADGFLIYEVSTTEVRFLDHRKTTCYCGGSDTCGEGETAMQQTLRALQGCEVLLCVKIGPEPRRQLEAVGIQPDCRYAMKPIEEAVAAVYAEMAAGSRLDKPVIALPRAA
jgi:nitrogen fixation protein NifB